MTNCVTCPIPGEGSGLRKIWALKHAVQLLGLGAEPLVRRMRESTESHWQRLAQQSAHVSFDSRRAYGFAPLVSRAVLAEAEALLVSVHLCRSVAQLRGRLRQVQVEGV